MKSVPSFWLGCAKRCTGQGIRRVHLALPIVECEVGEMDDSSMQAVIAVYQILLNPEGRKSSGVSFAIFMEDVSNEVHSKVDEAFGTRPSRSCCGLDCIMPDDRSDFVSAFGPTSIPRTMTVHRHLE